MTTIADLHWKRIVAGSVGTYAIATGALVVAIVLNTVLVAFGTGAEPDPGYLSAFNAFVGAQLFPVLTILLTVVAGAWVAHRGESDTATLHGIAVGVVAATIGLGFGAFDVVMAVRFVATVGAGVLGAKLAPLLFGD